MKIRVFDTDGVFRGGLLKLHMIGLKDRKWAGVPHADYEETLIDNSADQTGSWFLLRMSHTPDISGSKECDDEFDANSHALSYSLEEAARWLKENGYDSPPDLAKQVNSTEGGDGNGQVTTLSTPLPARQAMVWNLLAGRSLLAKEIAREAYNDYTKESAVRQVIRAIRHTGRKIVNRKLQGYFRPDSPPEFD